MGWGDELMVTGHVRELQAKDPRKVRIVYERVRWHEAWENNPRIARLDERGNFQDYMPRTAGLRPYATFKSQGRWGWKPYQPPVGELYFTDSELELGQQYADRIIFEPTLKEGASPNKNWGRDRWNHLYRLANSDGFRITQLGPTNRHVIGMAEHIPTATMRQAAAIIARARAVVVHEGGAHHVAAATKTPAVVIFGGFISPEVTGYKTQRNVFSGDASHPLGCGMRVRCKHCAEAMARIEPTAIYNILREILK